MHIGLTAREYTADRDIGGIGAYTRHSALGLRQAGHEVTIYAGTWQPRAEDATKQTYSARQRPSQPASRNVAFRQVRRLLPYRTAKLLTYSFGLKRMTQAQDVMGSVDVLEVPEWGAEGFASSLRRAIPLVVTLHTPTFLIQQYSPRPISIDDLLVAWLEKQTVLRGDMLICPSQSLAQVIANEYQIDLQRIRVVRYPVDTELFAPGKQEGEGDQVVLYVGKLHPRKGVHTLAQAIPTVIEACPHTRFVFAGADSDGLRGGRSCQEELREIVANAGVADRVQFLPPQPRAALIAIYQASALSVVPSRYDNLPYACLEAMACGKAVVASNAGGMAEIIRSGENGMLVEPEKPDLLAAALIGLLKDSPRRQEMGHKARAYVSQNLSCLQIAKRKLEIYAQVIAESHRA